MLQGSDSYFNNYVKKLKSHEFREVCDTDNSYETRENKRDDKTSNKNENQINFEKNTLN